MNLFQNLFKTNQTKTILGTDVSYYQGNGKTNDQRSWINWQVMQTKAYFTIIRAVVLGRVDSQFQRNYRGAKENKLPFGIYIYLNPAEPYLKQMEAIVSAARESMPKLGVWVDVEENGGLNPQELRDYIVTFVKDLQSQLPELEIGIYTRGEWWNTNVARDSFFKTLKLWIARYAGHLSSPWGDGKYKPLDWDTYTFWQFSDKGIAVDYGCPLRPYSDDDIDLNYYNGSEQDFIAEFGLEKPVDPPSDDLEVRVSALEEARIRLQEKLQLLEEKLQEELESTELYMKSLEERIKILEENPPSNQKDYILVQPKQNDKAVAYRIHSYNAKDFPIMVKVEPTIKYTYPETIKVYKEQTRADGNNYYYREYETEYYYRVDKVNQQ